MFHLIISPTPPRRNVCPFEFFTINDLAVSARSGRPKSEFYVFLSVDTWYLKIQVHSRTNILPLLVFIITLYISTTSKKLQFISTRSGRNCQCPYSKKLESSFSIIHLFLPNPGRILPALKKKSKKKSCPYPGLNPQPPDHQSDALLTELGRILLEISEVSFLLFHAPLHKLEFVYF